MTDIRAAHLDRLDELADRAAPRPRPVLAAATTRAARVVAVATAATGLLVILATTRPANAEPTTPAATNLQGPAERAATT